MKAKWRKLIAALQICTACYGYEDEGLFCTKCAKKHARVRDGFADYAEMPEVNSSRMDVCAYDGGVIDVERDGIFKK